MKSCLFQKVEKNTVKKIIGRLVKKSVFLTIVIGMMLSGGLPFSNGISLEMHVSAMAEAASRVQVITTKLSPYGYTPITVKAGIPVKWTIRAEAGSINGCNNVMVIPHFKIEKELIPGDNIIEFIPKKSGVFPYSCWMGMIYSKITVID